MMARIWLSMKDRLGRAALMASVLALSVALLGCLLSVARTVANTADALAEASGAELEVLPRTWLTDGQATGATGTPLDTDDVAAIQEIPGLTQVEPRIVGRGVIALRDDGTTYLPALAASQSGAFDPDSSTRLKLTEGQAPNSPGEVVLDPMTLQELGHQIGDDITLIDDVSSRTLRVRVVGIVAMDSISLGASSFILFSPEQARDLFLGGEQGWNSLALTLSGDADGTSVTGTVNNLLPYGYATATASAVDRAHRFWLHPALTTALVAVALLAFVVIMSAIALSSTAFGRLARVQSPTMTAMRVMGLSRFATWRTVMADALVVGAAGAFIGTVLGAIFQFAAHAALAEVGLPIGPPSPGLGLDGAAAIFAIGVCCALLGANQHALIASRTYPVASRRYGTTQRSWGDEAYSGLGMVAVALVLMLAQRLGAVPVPLVWAVASGVALVFGAVLAGSMVAHPTLQKVGEWLQGRTRGLSKVAIAQSLQRPHRITVGTAVLLIGAAVVSATGVVTASGQTTARHLIPASFTAPLVLTNERGHTFSQAVAQEISEIEGVTAVAAVGTQDVISQDDAMRLATADPGNFEAIFTTEVLRGRAPTKPNEVMVSAIWADEHRLTLDSLLRFTVGRSPMALRIVGIYQVAGDVHPADAVAVREVLSGHVAAADTWLGVTTATADAEVAVRATLEPMLAANPLMTLSTPDEMGEAQAEAVKENLLPFTELFLFALFTGMVSLALLLCLNVLDRRREYGAMRVMGVSEKQLAFMVLGEGVVLAAFGVALGLVTGTISGWAIQHALAPEGFSRLATDWGASLLSILWAIPIGLLAAVPGAALAYRAETKDSLPSA